MQSLTQFWHVLRVGAVAALLAAVTVASVACGPSSSEAGSAGDVPPILTLEQDGLLFTYHVLSNSEALFDLREDPRCLNNLAEMRPVERETFRRLLCRKYGVGDLDQLLDPNDPQLRQLRSLGYL